MHAPLSAAASPPWEAAGVAGGAYAGIPRAVVPHAVWLAWLLDRPVALRDPGGRIAHPMATSLASLMTFVGLPL